MEYASVTEIAKIEAGSRISWAPHTNPPDPAEPDNWAAHLDDKEYWDNCKDVKCISEDVSS